MTTTLPQTPTFEVHIGFSRKDCDASRRLLRWADWKLEEVEEVRLGPESTGCFDPHHVPGILCRLFTRRFHSTDEALAEVDHLGNLFRGYPDVRIELEQVLRAAPEPMPDLASLVPWVPTEVKLRHASLIPDTPTYETHFCVGYPDGTRIRHDTTSIIEVVSRAGVQIDQGVRFGPKDRIILTHFHQDHDEAIARAVTLGNLACRAVVVLDPTLSMRVVTERILLCAEPAVLVQQKRRRRRT